MPTNFDIIDSPVIAKLRNLPRCQRFKNILYIYAHIYYAVLFYLNAPQPGGSPTITNNNRKNLF